MSEKLTIKSKRVWLFFAIFSLPFSIIAIYFLSSHQWMKAAASFLLSIILGVISFIIKFFTIVKKHTEKSLEKRAEALGAWIASNIERVTVKLWWRLFSRFQGKYYDYLEGLYHYYQTEGLKSADPRRLNLLNVFVPLRVSPASPSQISPAMINPRAKKNNLDIWRFLASPIEKGGYKHIAVIGRPGSGKSTLLQHLTLTYVNHAQHKHNRKAPRLIPILLHVRDIKNEITGDFPPTLAELLQDLKGIKRLSPPQDWFEDRLKERACLVMLDGLDEVADKVQRELASVWINQQMINYAGSVFILTSRPHGYESDLVRQVNAILEVQPFGFEDIKSFIFKWNLETLIKEEEAEGRKDIARLRDSASTKTDDLTSRILDSPALAAMSTNPLLLTLITTLHHHGYTLPERRVTLYQEICEVLLERRQKAKNIPDTMTAKQKQAVLQVLALTLTQLGTLEFTISNESSSNEMTGVDGAFVIEDTLRSIPNTGMSPRDFLFSIEKVSGLIVETEPQLYEFAHRSFQDYLSASQIKDTHQEQLLINHIADPWWEETIRLYAGQSDASEIIRAALMKPTVESLTLASDCLEGALRISDQVVRQQLEDSLGAGLGSHDPTIARLAAEVKLSRRLKKMMRIGQNTWLDTSYISCAEYQLFINERMRLGDFRQPDHWPNWRFPHRNADEPIAGLRSEDALMFCEWLNNRHPWPGFKYQLPNKVNIDEFPILDSQIGCWSVNDRKILLANISDDLLQALRSELAHILTTYISIDTQLDPTTNYDLGLILKYVLQAASTFDFDYLWEHSSKSYESAEDFPVFIAHHFTHAVEEVQATARADALNRIRARIKTIGRGHIPDHKGIKDAHLLALDRGLPRDPSCPRMISLEYARYSNLLSFFFWFIRCDDLAKTGKISPGQPRELGPKQLRERQMIYQTYRDRSFNSYAFFVLLEARFKAEIPAWEGIRIARERV
jgi:energy-coupling factor transporter ATP-binding protein EcfA2